MSSSPEEGPLFTTIESYQLGAAEYAVHSRDRTALWGLQERFARLAGPNALIVDLGCGPGHDTALLAQRGLRAIGCDITWGMLNQARHHEALRGRLLSGDARALPLATACIDGVWACASLLHLRKVEITAALVETHRVLKPGGVLFTSMQHGSHEMVPYQPGLGLPIRHYFFYLADEWETLVKGAGFNIVDQQVNPTTHGLTQGATGWIETFARKPW